MSSPNQATQSARFGTLRGITSKEECSTRKECMFDICFSTPSVMNEDGIPQAGAQLRLGNDIFVFTIDLSHWSIPEYEQQWREGIRRVLERFDDCLRRTERSRAPHVGILARREIAVHPAARCHQPRAGSSIRAAQ